jgi:hypothetical protein
VHRPLHVGPPCQMIGCGRLSTGPDWAAGRAKRIQGKRRPLQLVAGADCHARERCWDKRLENGGLDSGYPHLRNIIATGIVAVNLAPARHSCLVGRWHLFE